MLNPEVSSIVNQSRVLAERNRDLLLRMRATRDEIVQQSSQIRKSTADLATKLADREASAETAFISVDADGPEPHSSETKQIADAKDLEGLNLLTPRELEVLHLLGEGYRTKEIAFRLGITFKTAVTHRSNIMEKLGIHEGPRLVRFAIRTGICTA